MHNETRSKIVCFGPFRLDLAAGELCVDGQRIRLQEQPFQLLKMLVERPGEVVTRDEIRHQLWPNGTVVEFDQSINAAIKKLRLALTDSAEEPRYVETVARRGYRLILPVERTEPIFAEPPLEARRPELPTANLTGKKISHYRVLEIVGGGMGVVYRAEDMNLGRRVALKFVPDELASDPKILARLRFEACSASALNHPNICTILEIEEQAGVPFIVMELLEGSTLRDRVSTGALPTGEVLDYALQIAEGLESAHQKGIIHRDIKPTNIFITNGGRVKILDFGLAKLAEAYQDTRMAEDFTSSHAALLSPGSSVDRSRSGMLSGTPSYMSPEQRVGDALDTRTDLFSFGAVLYEMATGVAPFRGDSPAQMRHSILSGSPLPASRVNPRLPSAIDRIVAKALEKNREKRYQSATEMRADLGRTQREIVLRGTRQRRLAWMAAMLLVVIAAITGAILWERGQGSTATAPDLVPNRLTANGPESPVYSAAISPNGTYLAYSDPDGVHVQSLGTVANRVLPNTRGMSVRYWSADGATVFLNDGKANYRFSLTDEKPRPLGNVVPFPDGQHVFVYAKDAVEIRDLNGKTTFSLRSDDSTGSIIEMAPGANWLAVTFAKPSVGPWIDAFQLNTGRRTTLVPPKPFLIEGLAWLSGDRLMYAQMDDNGTRFAIAPVNLWALTLNPKTGRPAGPAVRRTRWPDFHIVQLSATADGKSVSFVRQTRQQSIWIGALNAKASKLSGLRRLTHDESFDLPWVWTPDSKAVLFTSFRTAARPGGIYKQIVGAESAEALSRIGKVGVVRMSPDENWLIYDTPQGMSGKVQLVRVPSRGGEPQPILVVEGAFSTGVTCSHIAGGICELSEWDGKTTTARVFDPIKGPGALLFRVNGRVHITISPNGKHFAYPIAETRQRCIRITDLHGVIETDVTVAGVENLRSLDWSADSSGFFTSDLHGGETRLLHVERSGASQILWTLPGSVGAYGIPSPDGRFLATPRETYTANVWMVEQQSNQ